MLAHEEFISYLQWPTKVHFTLILALLVLVLVALLMSRKQRLIKKSKRKWGRLWWRREWGRVSRGDGWRGGRLCHNYMILPTPYCEVVISCFNLITTWKIYICLMYYITFCLPCTTWIGHVSILYQVHEHAQASKIFKYWLIMFWNIFPKMSNAC